MPSNSPPPINDKTWQLSIGYIDCAWSPIILYFIESIKKSHSYPNLKRCS